MQTQKTNGAGSNILLAKFESLVSVGANYLILTLKRPSKFRFLAGQYTTFYIQDKDGPFQRTFSIASAPHSAQIIDFCIQTLGDERGARFLKNLKEGDLIHLLPAQGTFHISSPENPIVLIAGGSGISPLRSLLLEHLHQSSGDANIHLFYGCKEAASIPFKDELNQISSLSGGQVTVSFIAETGKSKGVSKGTVVDLLKNHFEVIHSTYDYYLCGPMGMIKAVQELLSAAGVDEDHVFTEKYT